MPPKKTATAIKQKDFADFLRENNAVVEKINQLDDNSDLEKDLPDVDSDDGEPSARGGVSKNWKKVVDSAVFADISSILDSTEYQNLKCDIFDRIRATSRTAIICRNANVFAISNREELLTVPRSFSCIDSILQASCRFPMSEYFSVALQEVSKMASRGQEPSFDKCLAWLAFAAQSNLEAILPPGEEVYLNECRSYIDRLSLVELTPVAENERKLLANIQLSRVFQILASFKFESLSAEQKSVLLFAISRICMDTDVEPITKTYCKYLFSVLLNQNSNGTRNVIIEFSKIFPLLSDEMFAILRVVECLRLSNIGELPILCCISSVFISRAERCIYKWENAIDNEVPIEDLITDYLESSASTFNDVFDSLNEMAHEKCALLSLVDAAVSSKLAEVSPTGMKAWRKIFSDLHSHLKPNKSVNAQILDMFNTNVWSRIGR